MISLFLLSSAQSCSNYAFSRNRVFSSCNTLPYLNANLHWKYNPSSGTVEIAYRATQSTTRWIAWAINLQGGQMVGSQTLVAFQKSTGAMSAYTTSIDSLSPTMQQGKLSFPVSNIDAEYRNGEMIIYATVTLPNNRTTVTQVWQEGPVQGDQIGMHPTTKANTQAFGKLDFLSGQTMTTGGGNSRIRRRNVHGVLSVVSWGVLMPLGVIIARYLKVFKSADPAWFYLHAACQTSAYAVGVAGWGTGLKLGRDSVGIQYDTHRNIGIALFSLGTLQVFALFIRPKKDHKYRLYWNIYHHSIGYTVIILSIINVFKGLDILDPEKKWKHAYIGIIATLGGIAVFLEAITWPIVLKGKRGSSEKPHHGANGYGYGQTA
ncbi:hypothetical protein MRB53_004293 [Persea americana]|uniref:Uncharacterized protein n=1 Tax=Persea americana TaxID=3435 RepID=A0ACC2MA54_PERAE|nr:hypothetical protein MRB53_004293 [Persea americana]